MDFWTAFALIDAALFGTTEIILCFYVMWQNKWNIQRQWIRIVRALLGAASAAAMHPFINSSFFFSFFDSFRGLGRNTAFLKYIALGYLVGLRIIVCLLIYSMPRFKDPIYISGKVKLPHDDPGTSYLCPHTPNNA
jgi:hypothetical protein